MSGRNLLPPPPVEIEGTELKIEYISMLAQAQKAIGTGAIERVASFIGNLSAVKPEVLDKFDADQAVDEYADMLGAPPSIIVSDDDVEQIRAARAEAAAQAQRAEQAAAMAPAVKQTAEAARVLADTDAGGNRNLLQTLGIG
jgi:hypothetical protein